MSRAMNRAAPLLAESEWSLFKSGMVPFGAKGASTKARRKTGAFLILDSDK